MKAKTITIVKEHNNPRSLEMRFYIELLQIKSSIEYNGMPPQGMLSMIKGKCEEARGWVGDRHAAQCDLEAYEQDNRIYIYRKETNPKNVLFTIRPEIL